ncbi:hypothetical protein UFOVP715_60 [uncultured Caudovirales phage]|uniref:Uncharacterized protein n=1 Tax=uncultured Caudovirales phage TaxID=2100421 RepID=A0A6J5NLR1_9CAUD|nr:hypothetical protein UFOVP715_60 [uncultured Caudovirales phage]
MAKTITLEMADDGTITVMSDDMQEPYVCESIEECMQYLGDMLGGASSEAPEEQTMEGPEEYGQMWNEEAASRKPQPGLMA